MSDPMQQRPSGPADSLWLRKRKQLLRVKAALSDFTARSPARLALGAFLLVITLFTALLSAPFASASGEPTALHDALFTAVSAVCVTGLTTVSTAVHWSFFGQLILLVAMFIGGLGILTIAPCSPWRCPSAWRAREAGGAKFDEHGRDLHPG